MKEACKAIWPEFLLKWRQSRPYVILSLVATAIGACVVFGLEDHESLIFVFGVFAFFGGILLAAIVAIFMAANLVITWFRDVAELLRQRRNQQ